MSRTCWVAILIILVLPNIIMHDIFGVRPYINTDGNRGAPRYMTGPAEIAIKAKHGEAEKLHILQADTVELGWRDPYFWIASRWAPVIYQDTDSTYYKGDYITRFNFDGDWIGNNNWENLDNYDQIWAYVYYAVIETDTHYFIFYMFYHPRDWNDIPDAGLGEHENDMEGAMVVVAKNGSRYGEFLLMETRAHLDFYQYTNDSNIGSNSDDVDGGVIFNDGRPTVFIEAKGHGVYAWDGSDFPGGDGVVYRFCNNATDYPEYGDDQNVTYSLIPIMRSLWPRRYDMGDGHMYDKPFTYSGARYSFVNPIPEAFDGDTNTADAANPPWGMDDGDDGAVYKGDWFLDPAYTVATHLSIPYDFSLDYVYNPYLIEDGPEFDPPYIEIINPEAEEYLNSRTICVSWNVSDNSQLFNLTVSINGTIYYWTTQKGLGSTTIDLSSDGTYYLNITAMDYWGNYKTVIRKFVVDTVNPQVVIIEPENDSYHDNSTVMIGWNSTDDRCVDHIEIYLDGSLVAISYDWEGSIPVNMSDGNHTVCVRAYDLASNTGEATITVHVDTTPPSVEITYPENDTYHNSTSLYIRWSATDNFGVEKFEIYVDDEKYVELDGSYSEYCLSLSDGQHEIVIMAYDIMNHTSMDRVFVKIDTVPPSINIYEPQNNSFVSKEFTIKWDASDNFEIVLFRIYLNDSPIAELPGNTTEYNISVLESGDYIVEVVAIDAVDLASSSRIIVSIDDVPPELVFNHDNYTVFVENLVVISWESSDNYGVAERYIRVDDNSYVEIYKDNISLDLDDGQHIVRVRIVDVAGNYVEKCLVFYIDTGPPSITILSPENNSFHGENTLVISWRATDQCGISHTRINIDGDEYTVYNESIRVTLAEGKHRITITTYDMANRSASDTIMVFVDLTPPTITILAPANNSRHRCEVEVSWETTDNFGEISRVELYTNDSLRSIINGANGSEILVLDPGRYTITLKAYDMANNSDVKNITIFVVKIWITKPEYGENISSAEIVVEWEVMYIDTLAILVNGTQEATLDASVGRTTLYLNDGKFNITIVDTDNQYFWNYTTVTIDTIPPTLDLPWSRKAYNDTTVVLSWVSTDNGTGIMTYHVFANGTLMYEGRDNHATISLEEGIWIINITVKDYAGNTVWGTAILVVDITPPIIHVYPSDGSILNDTTVLVSWNISENLSGIDIVYVYINDSLLVSTNGSGYIYVNLTDGHYVVRISCTDIAGNTGEAESRIVVDAPPKLIVHGISNNSYINSGYLEINWTLFNGEISEQHLYVDGREIEVVLSYVSLHLAEGTHIIVITVVDTEGYVLEKKYVINVDITPPELTILSPQNNTVINNTRIQLRLDVWDNMAIDRIIVSSNSEVMETTNRTIYIDLIDGDNIVRVMVLDRAGNIDQGLVVITVDRISPVVKILEPANGTTVQREVMLRWFVRDNTGIGRIEILVNGEVIAILCDGTNISIILNDTTNIVMVRVWDLAGNMGCDSIVIFTEKQQETSVEKKLLQEVRVIGAEVIVYLALSLIMVIALIKKKRTKRRITEEGEPQVLVDEDFLEIEEGIESLYEEEQ